MATNKSPVCHSPLREGIKLFNLCPNQSLKLTIRANRRAKGKKRIKHKALLSLCSPFSSILSSSLRVCGLVLLFWFACVLCSDGQLFLKSLQGLEKRCCCTDRLVGEGEAGSGLGGAVISSVQMRTCFCLWDAAPSQTKDSGHVRGGIMGTLFPVHVLGEGKG